MNPEIAQRVALVGVGAVVGGGAAWFLSKRSTTPAGVVSVPAGKPIDGPVPMPHTLSTPAGKSILSPRHAELLKYGLPTSTQLQLKENYVSLVDYRLREPVWVMEHLTKDNLKGGADRANHGFVQDHDVPKPYRQTNDDYLKSGYSRGHMSPASNNKVTPDAMKESFLLNSNIVPQDLDNNMFYWNRMEQWVKHLATKKGFDAVHVLSGPLFLPSKVSPNGLVIEASSNSTALTVPSDPTHLYPPSSAITVPPPSDVYTPPPADLAEPNNSMIPAKPFHYVTYKTIGDTHVAVPTHLFKAVLAEKSQGPGKPPAVFFASFIVPNTPINERLPLRAFQVPRETLEKYAGFRVYDRAFDMMPVTDLCAVNDPDMGKSAEGKTMCQLEHASAFNFFVAEREIAKAGSRAELEKAMAKANQTATKFNVPVPSNLLAAYEKQARKF
ncbi:hypothetical protein H9P43_007376 [Blastocladiella emersonii ATCC 22665]|nr:hypothetical protein H9P43_007376 [Blastocladiella emersonii ATCC 22665]